MTDHERVKALTAALEGVARICTMQINAAEYMEFQGLQDTTPEYYWEAVFKGMLKLVNRTLEETSEEKEKS